MIQADEQTLQIILTRFLDFTALDVDKVEDDLLAADQSRQIKAQ